METKNSPAGSQCGRLSRSQKKILLEESGIHPRLVVGRGYRTVDTKAEPGRLGFSHSLRNVPGLLVPIHGPTGEVVLYQPDPTSLESINVAGRAHSPGRRSLRETFTGFTGCNPARSRGSFKRRRLRGFEKISEREPEELE